SPLTANRGRKRTTLYLLRTPFSPSPQPSPCRRGSPAGCLFSWSAAVWKAERVRAKRCRPSLRQSEEALGVGFGNNRRPDLVAQGLGGAERLPVDGRIQGRR